MVIKKIFLGATCICCSLATSSTTAAVVVDFREINGGVIAIASGALDLTGLVDDDTFFAQIGVRGDPSYFVLGAQGDGSSNAEGYNGVTGPSQFGSGGFTAPTSSSGDIIGVNTVFFGDLFVSRSYVSGDAINARAAFAGQTFASLGLDPGTYVFSWPADSIIVNIGTGDVPEPASWAMMIAGFSMVGLAMKWGSNRRRTLAPIDGGVASLGKGR